MLNLEKSLANAQVSAEVQPRVFYEDFRNYVLYVQDVRAGVGAANWRGIFLADVSDPDAPKITTADRATVVSGPRQSILMRLRDGTEHQTVDSQPGDYTVSTFQQTDLPAAGRRPDQRAPGPQRYADSGHEPARTAGPHAWQKWAAVRDRVPEAAGLPGGLSGADAGRRTPGNLLPPRRQERRLCADHRAGLHLLLPFLDRHGARAPGQDPGLCRGVGSQSDLLRVWHRPAAANGDRGRGAVAAFVGRQLVPPARQPRPRRPARPSSSRRADACCGDVFPCCSTNMFCASFF